MPEGDANGIGLSMAQALACLEVKLVPASFDAPALKAAKVKLQTLTSVESAVLDVCNRDIYARTAEGLEHKLVPALTLGKDAGVTRGG